MLTINVCVLYQEINAANLCVSDQVDAVMVGVLAGMLVFLYVGTFKSDLAVDSDYESGSLRRH